MQLIMFNNSCFLFVILIKHNEGYKELFVHEKHVIVQITNTDGGAEIESSSMQ